MPSKTRKLPGSLGLGQPWWIKLLFRLALRSNEKIQLTAKTFCWRRDKLARKQTGRSQRRILLQIATEKTSNRVAFLDGSSQSVSLYTQFSELRFLQSLIFQGNSLCYAQEALLVGASTSPVNHSFLAEFVEMQEASPRARLGTNWNAVKFDLVTRSPLQLVFVWSHLFVLPGNKVYTAR